MGVLIFFIVAYILLCFTLQKLFAKAGEEASKAWIPGVNFGVWARIIGRKPAYAWWLLFPIVNIFILAGMCVDMARSFGKHRFWQAALSVIYAPAMFYLIGNDEQAKYEGPVLENEKAYYAKLEEAQKLNKTAQYKKLAAKNPYQKSWGREWVEAIVFAVFAAAFIRMFLIEAYNIPTSSMEGSLNVGDFLFVSKAHYGIRTPKTIAMIPLLHNRVPVLNTESYLEKPNIPFTRLPALENIDHGDPIVFNYPEGDSVYVTPYRTFSIYDTRRNDRVKELVKSYDLITRPMDKMDHYIKRSIGNPGDSIEIRNRQVYLNGQAVENPQNLQYNYMVTLPENGINRQKFRDWGISVEDQGGGQMMQLNTGTVPLTLTDEQKKLVQGIDQNIKIEYAPVRNAPGSMFPFDPNITQNWTVDDYGPIWLPKAGATTPLTLENLPFYERIISVYEHNDLQVSNGKIFINGAEANSYTFQQDYYFGIGDNRQNSEDSRFWGYVPADHIVGKPLFVWFSTKEGNIRNGINWGRIFKSVSKLAK